MFKLLTLPPRTWGMRICVSNTLTPLFVHWWFQTNALLLVCPLPSFLVAIFTFAEVGFESLKQTIFLTCKMLSERKILFFYTMGRKSILIVIPQEKPFPCVHTRRAATTYQVLVHHHHHCEHLFWKYLLPSIRHQVHADDAEKHFIVYLPSTDLIWSDRTIST